MFTLIIIIIILVFVFGGSGESSSSNQSTTSSTQRSSQSNQSTTSSTQRNSRSNQSTPTRPQRKFTSTTVESSKMKVTKTVKECPKCKKRNLIENLNSSSTCNNCNWRLFQNYNPDTANWPKRNTYKPTVENAKHTTSKKVNQDKAITVRLTGVTYEGRQEIISKMQTTDEIFIKRDNYNKYDKNAIGVNNNANQSLGWIPRDIASTLAPNMDAGIKYRIKINKILGGNGYNFGLEVLISKEEEILKSNQVEDYNFKSIKSISENKYSGSYRTVVPPEDKSDYLYESSSSYIDKYDDYDDYNEYSNNSNDDGYGDSEAEIWEHQWEYNQNH